MKYIIVLLLVVVMGSCDLVMDETPYEIDYCGYEYDIDTFMYENQLFTIDSIWYWISHNIYYKAEGKGKDHWQSPEETMTRRTGDCEDYAILMHYMLYKIGYFSALVHTNIGGSHILIYCESKFIEPQVYLRYYLIPYNDSALIILF